MKKGSASQDRTKKPLQSKTSDKNKKNVLSILEFCENIVLSKDKKPNEKDNRNVLGNSGSTLPIAAPLQVLLNRIEILQEMSVQPTLQQRIEVECNFDVRYLLKSPQILPRDGGFNCLKTHHTSTSQRESIMQSLSSVRSTNVIPNIYHNTIEF